MLLLLTLAASGAVTLLASKPVADLAGLPPEQGLMVAFAVTAVAGLAVHFAFGAMKSLALLAVLAFGVGIVGAQTGYLPAPAEWVGGGGSPKQPSYTSSGSSPSDARW